MSSLFFLIDDLFQLQITRDHPLALYPTWSSLPSWWPEYHADSLNHQGDIQNIPYSQYYHTQLAQITKALHDFAITTAIDRPSEDRLVLDSFIAKREEVCHTNDWLSLEEFWVQQSHRQGKYLLSLWPIENYSDPLWWTKRLFTAVLLRRDDRLATDIKKICTFVSRFASRAFPDCPQTPVSVWMGNIVDWAGEIKSVRASWRSRPEQTDIINRVWSIKQIFLDQTVAKARAEYLPLHSLLAQELWCLLDEGSVKDFFQNYFWIGLLCHELGHTIGKYPGYPERMSERYQTIEENRAEIIAIKLWYELYDENIGEKHLTWLFLWTWLLASCSMWRGYHHHGERKAYRYHFPIFARLREAYQIWDDRVCMEHLYAELMSIVHRGTKEQCEQFHASLEYKKLKNFL